MTEAEATTTETVEETKAEETASETKVEEVPKPAPRKQSRAEKKMRETLLKHNLQQLENVTNVMMRKGNQLMWTFASPDVYYIENVYVIFGEPSMDDPGKKAVETIQQNAQIPAAEEAPATVIKDDVEESAEGLKEDDINTVMQQSGVSRNRAIQALREANGDLVTAVMNLAI